jgi:hydrogenase expression/formation protein HypC
MCLAVPGKIIEIYQADEMRMARVDFGGVTRQVCLEALPAAKVGDYTIIHAGFALSILNEEEALESLEVFKDLSDFEASNPA